MHKIHYISFSTQFAAGRPVTINASSTFYINATVTPSPTMKWRTEKGFAFAFLIWGNFQEENGDFLQLNRRVFRGETRCRPVPVLIHSQERTKTKSVLVGLGNNSGLATLKFAYVVLGKFDINGINSIEGYTFTVILVADPSLWNSLKDILFCKEVLEYVGVSVIYTHAH